MLDLLCNNNSIEISLAFRECLKNWHVFLHFGTPSWKIVTPLMAHWHVIWHMGTFISMLVHNEKLERFDTLAHRHVGM